MDNKVIADIAHVVYAEAGPLCGPIAMIAIAWVYSRNPVMYGKYAPVEPNPMAYQIAQVWQYVPDPTYGAYYAFSGEDLLDPRVQAIVAKTGDPTLVIECRGGGSLHFYRDPWMSPPIEDVEDSTAFDGGIGTNVEATRIVIGAALATGGDVWKPSSFRILATHPRRTREVLHPLRELLFL